MIYFFHQNHNKSTGQKLSSQLMQISNISDVDVIILDEWDANLDGINKSHLDELINELARQRLVIEVRH